MKDETKAKTMIDFLQWATHDGQKLAAPLNYAPLTEALQAKVGDALSKITTK